MKSLAYQVGFNSAYRRAQLAVFREVSSYHVMLQALVLMALSVAYLAVGQ